MEETQDGRNICFIDSRISVGLHLGRRVYMFEYISIRFEHACLSITRGENVAIPEVLHAVHNRCILEHEKNELVVLSAIKTVKFALLNDFTFLCEDTVFVVFAL
jgi:hypothetical protein